MIKLITVQMSCSEHVGFCVDIVWREGLGYHVTPWRLVEGDWEHVDSKMICVDESIIEMAKAGAEAKRQRYTDDLGRVENHSNLRSADWRMREAQAMQNRHDAMGINK